MTTTKKILAAAIFTLSVHSSLASDVAQLTQGQKIY